MKARVKARLLGGSPKACIGRFELLRRLGQGGEGTVYEARDVEGETRIALKQLHSAYAASGASLKREFRALADLVHPNLVALHELFHISEQWFYTMELVEGLEFGAYARPAGVLCGERLRASLSQLLVGLDALHAAGKIHRDLKPSNVLVRADGRLLILDYGLVIDLARAPWLASSTAGTPAYAAPEQVAGHAEPASDLYAVGVMLFQALTGTLPISGSVTTVLTHKRGRTANAPSLHEHDVPRDLATLCTALLADDPAQRPTARRALALFHDGPQRPIAARRARPVSGESFVGRRALLLELHALAATRVDAPCVVLLRGESGIGKSALLRRFCSERAEAGAVVLDGRCYEREHVPYKALDAIVESLVEHLLALTEPQPLVLPGAQRAALVRLFPAFARLPTHDLNDPDRGPLGDASELRRRAFAAVKTLFQALAARHEVVFAVDDLQWGDLDSIDLLQHVLGGANAPAIFVIGAYRSDELHSSPVMQAIFAGDALGPAQLRRVELEVGPLADDEADELLRELAPPEGPLSPRQLDTCIVQASGLPFALQQLAEHVGDSERGSGGEAELGDVVRMRARRCSAGARRLLDVLCVAGHPLETQLALRSCARADASWSDAAELCGRKLARWRDTEHERCLEPYHDLVRRALLRSVGAERVRAIHAGIVVALEQAPLERLELLVEHLLGAEQHERAGLTALRAADRAGAQLAWNRAADLLRTAQSTLSQAQLHAHAVHERLAAALASATRHRQSAVAYLEAASRNEGTEGRRLEGLAAQQQLRAGDTPSAIVLLAKLLGEVGYRVPDSELESVITWVLNRARLRVIHHLWPRPRQHARSAKSAARMQVLSAAYGDLWVREPKYGPVIHTWMLREARRARDEYWVRALASEAAYLITRYGPKAAKRASLLLSALDEMRGVPCEPYTIAMCHMARALYALQGKWDMREALRRIADAEAQFAHHCPGSHFERSWVRALRDFALEMTGECGVLIEEVTARERHARNLEDGYSQDQRLMTMPLLETLRDNPDAAIAFARANWTRPRRFALVDYAVVVRVSSVLLYRGDAAAAHAHLLDHWWALRRSGLLLVNMVRENAWYHRARNAAALYWCTRERGLKREALRRVRSAQAYPPVLRGLYRLLEASIARADGRIDACRAALIAAIADSVSGDAGASEWMARYRLAELDARADDLAAAAAWFRARAVQNPARWVAIAAPGDDWSVRRT